MKERIEMLKYEDRASAIIARHKAQAEMMIAQSQHGYQRVDVHTRENKEYLLSLIKEQLGITDDDISTLSTGELKNKIRNIKINKLTK